MIDSDDPHNWLLLSRMPEFWEMAGHLSSEETTQRWAEIPVYYKPLAYTIIRLSIWMPGCSCFFFRQMLFICYKRLLERGQIDLERKPIKPVDIHLPYYWYGDGVMVPPEYIVKISNGIVGFRCDESVEKCLMSKEECRFRDVLEEKR